MDKVETSIGVAQLFSDKLNRFLGSVTDEIKQSLSKSLQAYTKNWYERTSKVKTFIYRDGSVDFNSIYFPLTLSKGKKNFVVPEQVEDFFKTCNYLTVLGHAGSGKTMLMRHFFLSILERRNYIPVIIELRDLNRYGGSLYEYISQFVFNMRLAVNEQIMNRLMESGEFVFFFDGYDELSLESKGERTLQIQNFVDCYPNNYYMLTSRPDAGAESLPRFENYHVCPLSIEQVKSFIHQQTSVISDGVAMEEKMIKAIQITDDSILAYLSNPLLLSMFILTFSFHPSIPSRKTDFYYNVFDTLFTKHDSITKGGGFVHDRACKLERYQYIKLLQWFSYRTYFKQQFVFSPSMLHKELNDIHDKLDFEYGIDDLIYDLSVAISILVQDGLDYTFPHRSMQEYFAAQLISGLPEQVRVKVYGKSSFAYIGNQNLWSLCLETDEYEFKKFFIASHLNNYIDTVENAIKDKENKSLAFLEYVLDASNLMFEVADNGHVLSMSGVGDNISTIACFYFKINLNIIDNLVHWFFRVKKELLSVLKPKYGDNMVFPFHTTTGREKEVLIPLLVENNIHSSMYQMYLKIRELTNDLNIQLIDCDHNNEDLLNIS